MDFIQAIALGIVQGITEFLPISSSGHLILAHDLLHFEFIDNASFDVALHIGTLVALLIFFWRECVTLIVAFFRSFAKWNVRADMNQRLAWLIILGSIPAGVIGYLFDSEIEASVRSPWVVVILLISVGLLFLLVERYSRPTKDVSQLTWRSVLLIGSAQALALAPGVSRSGITMIGGMTQGLPRRLAARFSFLLSIPVIFGAGIKKILDITQIHPSSHEWLVLLVSVVVSALVGCMVIAWLLRYLERHSLAMFAYYRFFLSAAVIIYLLLR